MKISEEDVLVIPGKEYYLKLKNKGIQEGIDIGLNRGRDEGMIDAYYNDMKLSPEDIAKKMDKPLEEVQEIIQNLSDES